MNRRDILKAAPATLLAGYAAPAVAMNKADMIRHYHSELVRLLSETCPQEIDLMGGFFDDELLQATAYSPGLNDGSDRRMAIFKSTTGIWEPQEGRRFRGEAA